jgi:hypothetical protein
VEFFIGCAFLALLYSRLKAKFLVVWLVGNAVDVIPRILDATYPQSPDRPAIIGATIEVLWSISHVFGLVGTYMLVKWFWKTRTPNQASHATSEPAPGAASSARGG